MALYGKGFRTLLAGAALSMSAACAGAPQPLDGNLIEPGVRVGAVRIGMPLSELLRVMGTPDKTTPMPGSSAAQYSYDGLTVAAHETVYWIIADDPRFHTARGVAPGSEQIVARSAFPKPACVVTQLETTIYDYRNIYIEVQNDTGRVKQIGVLQKTKTCDD